MKQQKYALGGVLAAVPGREAATAATVIFRLGSVLFDAQLGALVYCFFWRGEKERA